MTNGLRSHPGSRKNFLRDILIGVPLLIVGFFTIGYAILYVVGETVEHFTP